jgi:hypothetical protein
MQRGRGGGGGEKKKKKKRLNAQTNRNKEPRKAVKETAGRLGTQRVNK